MITVQIIISGKVQGVWYRKSTKEKADSLGLKGTVQNLNSGDVKIIAQGNQAKINLLVEWARTGPKFAEVHSLSKKLLNKPPHFDKFIIIR